jgi:putative flippase GtrA
VTSALAHWLKFNAVGVIGVGVQLVVLTLLKSGLGIHYLLATFLAVEATILHNFIWHERWTWIDRTAGAAGILKRLVRFNLANGLVSLGGNLGLMWFFVSRLHLNYLFANLAAIALCSIVNFVVSDKLVFLK